METLFHRRLPVKIKALSQWKTIDIQRINPDEPDYRRISSHLGKQTNLELIAIDLFNRDLSTRKKWEEINLPSPTQKATPSNSIRHCCSWREADAWISQHFVEKRLLRNWSDWRQSNEGHHHSAAWCGGSDVGWGAEAQQGL